MLGTKPFRCRCLLDEIFGDFFFCAVNFINCGCHARKTPFQFVCFKNDSRLHTEELFDKSKSHHSQDFCVIYTFREVFFF